MPLAPLPDPGEYNFRGVRMEMLVTKFSNGKYRNEGELFAEPIKVDNVKLMGEVIALQSLRTAKKYDWQIADQYYIGLIKDLHHMGEVDYIVSDGYDVAQTAICFLYQFLGKRVSDIYGKDSKGIEITIKLACYRELNRELKRSKRKAQKTEYIDFMHYKALPMDPVNCFEKEQIDYTKADAILEAMHLNEMELAVLDCVLRGLVRSEIIAELGIGRGSICYRKRQIRSKYQAYIGNI